MQGWHIKNGEKLRLEIKTAHHLYRCDDLVFRVTPPSAGIQQEAQEEEPAPAGLKTWPPHALGRAKTGCGGANREYLA